MHPSPHRRRCVGRAAWPRARPATFNIFSGSVDAVTLAPSLNVTPCFSRMRWNDFGDFAVHGPEECGRGIPHHDFGPEPRHTEPRLEPDHAGPSTSIFFRHLVEQHARQVRRDERFSSISMPFSFATSEPVAMTMFFVSSVSTLPSRRLHLDLPVPTMRPGALIGSILFFLNKKATPWCCRRRRRS